MKREDILFVLIMIGIIALICGLDIWYTQAVATSEVIPAWLKVFLLR